MLGDSTVHHLFYMKTYYSVNNGRQPKLVDSLAFCLCAKVRCQNEPLGMMILSCLFMLLHRPNLFVKSYTYILENTAIVVVVS